MLTLNSPVTAPNNSIRVVIVTPTIGTATHAHLRQKVELLDYVQVAFKLSINIIVFNVIIFIKSG